MVVMEAKEGSGKTFDEIAYEARRLSSHDRVSRILVVPRTATDSYWTWTSVSTINDTRGDVQDVAAESMAVDPLPDLSGQPQKRRGGSVGSCTTDIGD